MEDRCVFRTRANRRVVVAGVGDPHLVAAVDSGGGFIGGRVRGRRVGARAVSAHGVGVDADARHGRPGRGVVHGPVIAPVATAAPTGAATATTPSAAKHAVLTRLQTSRTKKQPSFLFQHALSLPPTGVGMGADRRLRTS